MPASMPAGKCRKDVIPMRIKLASIVVSVILAAILVGYTMAWFTDSDKVGPQTLRQHPAYRGQHNHSDLRPG